MSGPLISCDANILLIAFNASAAGHARAFAFLEGQPRRRRHDRIISRQHH